MGKRIFQIYDVRDHIIDYQWFNPESASCLNRHGWSGHFLFIDNTDFNIPSVAFSLLNPADASCYKTFRCYQKYRCVLLALRRSFYLSVHASVNGKSFLQLRWSDKNQSKSGNVRHLYSLLSLSTELCLFNVVSPIGSCFKLLIYLLFRLVTSGLNPWNHGLPNLRRVRHDPSRPFS